MRTLFTSWALILKEKHISSREIVLIDKHISLLERWTPKFQAADPKKWDKIINEAADRIKSAWTDGPDFDRDVVIRVCGLSV